LTWLAAVAASLSRLLNALWADDRLPDCSACPKAFQSFNTALFALDVESVAVVVPVLAEEPVLLLVSVVVKLDCHCCRAP